MWPRSLRGYFYLFYFECAFNYMCIHHRIIYLFYRISTSTMNSFESYRVYNTLAPSFPCRTLSCPDLYQHQSQTKIPAVHRYLQNSQTFRRVTSFRKTFFPYPRSFLKILPSQLGSPSKTVPLHGHGWKSLQGRGWRLNVRLKGGVVLVFPGWPLPLSVRRSPLNRVAR